MLKVPAETVCLKYELAITPPVGYFFIYPTTWISRRRLGWSQYMRECVGTSQGYYGVYRAAQTVLSRCCHVLVTVHAGASQGYVLGIPLYPTGRSIT